MPLYEYTCCICSNAFERLRPVGQMDDEAPCPDCGSESERQLSVFATISAGGQGEPVPVSAGAGGGCCGAGGCC